MSQQSTGEQWICEGGGSRVGRSFLLIRCPCGELVKAYKWSWAGHGVKPCPKCKRGLLYWGGVKPPK